MAVKIDDNYKLDNETLVRVITPVCLQETGYSDPIKAARMVEGDIGDGAGWNYGCGSFTTRAGGMNTFMPFLKTYYPKLYSKLANDSKWESTTFKKSWQNLADGKNGMDFYYAQAQFLWFYDGVTAIKTLKNKGFSIKLDGSRLEMVGAILSIIHNQNPSWIYTKSPKYSWHNVVYRAFQKYPNDSGVNLITYICDYISNNYNGTLKTGVRNGWKRNKTRLLALTNPLKNASVSNPEQPSTPEPPTPEPSDDGDDGRDKLPTKILEQTIKACDGIPSIGYIGTNKTLPEDITYNDKTENTKYPSDINYCYIDFTDNADDEITLIKSLMIKYPSKPVFIAKTSDETINAKLSEFASITQNVYFIDTGVYSKPSTQDDIDDYYTKIKDVISKTVIGYKKKEENDSPGKTPPELEYPSIKEELKANGSKDFGKVSGLYVTLPSKADKSYYSRFSFSTVETTKYTQDVKLFLTGDDVTLGQLIPKPNSTYDIIVLYNTDTSTNGGNDITSTAVSAISDSNTSSSTRVVTLDVNITQESIVDNIENSAAYSKYKTFFDNVDVDDGIIIPGLKSNMVPQGMTYSGNYIYVSAYDHSEANNSCIYIINMSTKKLVKTVWLDNKNHVGGITTNGTYLYITCGNRIGVVSLSTVNSAKNNADIELTYISIENDVGGLVRCSTCVYDSSTNLLWVAQYNETDTEGDYAYAYKVNGIKSLTYSAKIKDPQYTQGLFFEGSTVYYSTSYGRNRDSLLYKCTWGGDDGDYWYKTQEIIKMPPTSEGIFKCGNIMYVLFENASYHYMTSDNIPKYPVDRIYGYKISREMYYGIVTKKKSGTYEDFKDSLLRKDAYSILNTYEKNSNKMLYHNGTTCVSNKNPDSIKDKWINPNTNVGDDKRYYIDCSTLCKLYLMGLTWGKSPYVKKTTNTVRNSAYSWSFNYNEIPRTAAEQAEWCVKSGYALYGIDTVNFSNLEEGDLIFYDRDTQDNGRFMNISHVAMVYKIENDIPYTIEATNAGGTQSIRVIKVSENTPDKILLFARIKKY